MIQKAIMIYRIIIGLPVGYKISINAPEVRMKGQFWECKINTEVKSAKS